MTSLGAWRGKVHSLSLCETFSQGEACSLSRFDQSALPSKLSFWLESLNVTLFGGICCQCCISYLSTGFSTKSATKRGERKISLLLSSFERIDFVDNEPFACDVLDSAGHTVPCKLCFVRALLFYRDPCLTQWVLWEDALLLKDNEQCGIVQIIGGIRHLSFRFKFMHSQHLHYFSLFIWDLF